MPKRTWSDAQLTEAIKSAPSLKEAARSLGLRDHHHLLPHIDRLKLDTSHMHRTLHKISLENLPLCEILVEDRAFSSSCLRVRLIKEGLLENLCSECKMPPVWQGKSLTFHLHHINGVPSDNRLENLAILCPNCHSQTESYCGKGDTYNQGSPTCPTCGGFKSNRSAQCGICTQASQPKIQWPSLEVLLREIQATSISATAKSLGVTPPSVKKHIAKATRI